MMLRSRPFALAGRRDWINTFPMSDKDTHPEPLTSEKALEEADKARLKQPAEPNERGGPKGPEPTRYNDWTVKGRCIDF